MSALSSSHTEETGKKSVKFFGVYVEIMSVGNIKGMEAVFVRELKSQRTVKDRV